MAHENPDDASMLEKVREAARIAAGSDPSSITGEDLAAITHWSPIYNEALLDVLREIEVVGSREGIAVTAGEGGLAIVSAIRLLELLAPCIAVSADQDTATAATLTRKLGLSLGQSEFRLALLEVLGLIGAADSQGRRVVLTRDVSFVNDQHLVEVLIGKSVEAGIAAFLTGSRKIVELAETEREVGASAMQTEEPTLEKVSASLVPASSSIRGIDTGNLGVKNTTFILILAAVLLFLAYKFFPSLF